jgi:ankyrin repeat protein
VYDQTPLMHSCYSGEMRIIKLLVESGANVNAFDINGITPLHILINRRDDDLCDYILSQGVALDKQDKQGCTPLATAVINDYAYLVFKLLKLGADPNIADVNGKLYKL